MGTSQDPIDGTSMMYTFDDAKAPTNKKPQFFNIMGSRGIYHDGYFACTFDPREPWSIGKPNIRDWNPLKDKWQLYDINQDWSQENDTSAQN